MANSTAIPPGSSAPPPAPTTAAPPPAPAIAPSSPAPASAGNQVVWGPPTTTDFKPAASGAASPGLYDLNPQYPSVPLPALVKQLASNPDAIKTLVAAIQAKTGVTLPPEVISQLLADPDKTLGMLAFTPAQLQDGARVLNKQHQLTNAPDDPPAPNLIQGSTFDLSTISGVAYTRTPTAMTPIQPGAPVFTGQIQDPSISDAQSKANAVTSEVLNRLAANTPGNPQFTVTYKGQPYTTLGGLIDALQANGNKVTAVVQQRIADFMPLYVQNPKAPGGYVDVADPVMVATGIRRNGQQAVVPANHSQLCFNISGPDLNADVRFFQGTDGTGFHPATDTLTPAWTGMAINDTYAGADAVEAIKVSSLLKQALVNVSDADHFMLAGYGEVGVCNDSVALVEQVVHHKNTAYPLLLQPKLVLPELDRELAQTPLSPDDRTRLQQLRDAVAAFHPDTQAGKDPTRPQRILDSIPWPPGQEAFPTAAAARQILQPLVAK